MGQDQSSVFDLAAVAAASNGGNNDPLLPPARFIGDPQKPSRMPYNKYASYSEQIPLITRSARGRASDCSVHRAGAPSTFATATRPS